MKILWLLQTMDVRIFMLTFRQKFLVFHGLVCLMCLGAFFLFHEKRFVQGGGLFVLYGAITSAVFFILSRPLKKLCASIMSVKQEEGIFPLIELTGLPQGDFRNVAAILNEWLQKMKALNAHVTLARIESEDILEAIGEGVVLIDSNGNATFINQIAAKLLKIACKKGLSQPLWMAKTNQKDLLIKCQEMIQHVLQTSEPNVQTWNEGKGFIRIDLIARPRQGRGGVILVVQDKTSHYKVLEMDKDFIANVSHELRTPITIIQGFAETLRDHMGLSRKKLGEISEKIVRTSQRLEKLIQSLLILSDVDHLPEHSLQMTDLVSLAEHCKHLFLTAHPMAKIAFATNRQSVQVLATPDLLDLAIMNLLDNAIKYSSSQQHIHLSIQSIEEKVCLEVRDQGIGIPEADLPHIFNRFYTVDKARSRKSGGAGLGLAIVKTIIEKHRGTISVSSQLGAGSTFTITLPLSHSRCYTQTT